MDGAVWGFIVSHYPALGIGVFALVLIVIATIRITTFVNKSNKIHEEFPGVKTDLGKLKTDLKCLPEIQASMSKMHTALSSLNTVLLDKQLINTTCYASSNSPLALNTAGNNLIKESGADVIFESMKKELIEDLLAKDVKSLLQLERASLALLFSKMDDPRFKQLQDFAFEHPTFENNSLSFSDILFVMSLVLRDSYRSQHPELDEEER